MKVLVNLVVVAACAVWNIRDGLQGSTPLLLLGCVLALWAVFIALNWLRRRIPVIVSDMGLVVNRIVRSPVHIQWSQIETAKLPEAPWPAVIGWRASPDAELQFTGISQRTLGEEGAKALRNAIFAARPDLSEQTPEGMNAAS